MQPSSKCRLGLYLGLDSLSYVKVDRKAGEWRVVDSGDIAWSDHHFNPESNEDEFRTQLQRICKEAGVQQESAQLSMHSRYCVSRVATGDQRDVEDQLDEFVNNSQHYLQLGLGENLFGRSSVAIDAQHQYGQLTIIKRGLIETIESSLSHAGLMLETVGSGLSGVGRLAGFSGLDASSPLLLVCLGASGAEIGISYQGRLQLNYHAGACTDVARTAQTIKKHLKRLKRYCDRYRQLDGSSELSRVLILGEEHESQELSEQFQTMEFEQVYTLKDLCKSNAMAPHMGDKTLDSSGIASALGSLLVHLEDGLLPTTNLYESYLSVKPRSRIKGVLRDGWSSIVAACLLVAATTCSWWCQGRLDNLDTEFAMLAETFDEEHLQLEEVDQLEELLTEYMRLEDKIHQAAISETVAAVASCLPADTRIDWFGIDSEDRLILKGTMLQGDQSYEILKALRGLPAIAEVALESVGRSTTFGKSATFFEIHCQFAETIAKPDQEQVAQARIEGAQR